MPIYAYRCAACGHAKDVLQKMSDPVLSVCPACGASAFTKQVTAAGFQLKGSGWYVTDFRGDAKGRPAKDDAGDGAKADASGSDASADAKPADKPTGADNKPGAADKPGAAGDAKPSAKAEPAAAAAPAAAKPAAGPTPPSGS